MITVKNIVTAVAVGAITLGAVGTTAQAGDYGRGYGPRPHYGHGGYGYGRHIPAPQPHYGYHHRRDRTGEKIATGVAIGVGALILGSILANQNRRSHYNGY